MKVIQINPSDNVAVAIHPTHKGETVSIGGKSLTVADDIPAGHKLLLEDLRQGADVIKYGYPIGHLTSDRKAGALVDDTNIKTNLSGLLDYEYNPVGETAVDTFGIELPPTFRGFRRRNGEVGIRNDIWIVPTVGCVNGVCNEIAARFNATHDTKAIPFGHNYGCSQLSEDHENTRLILRDLVLHPNAGAVLIVGLGCENNQPDKFLGLLGDYDTDRIRLMVCQQVEGDEVGTGLAIMEELHALVSSDQRQDIPTSELRIGLKCGGSDGFSGITANPLLGVFSDMIVKAGGTSVLTEVPEMFGAETILMNRCENEELFRQTVSLINDFKAYFLSHGEPVGENPSPGNKAGGISTLEEKALGCTQKCGKSPVRGVLRYAERLESKGLNLLSAPGNDLVASTALAASGCHIVLFTTGRGTPFGTFVPTMKISTNTTLYRDKPNWIDFNAGTLLEGTSMAELARAFARQVLSIANGTPTNNELHGYHEIAIFKTGVTL
ncbi:MAG: altronate dehydratase family protein [Bacteroidaceae bacterium]|nr:altronate dehydratase family protein [Bacteroidaceae bacterium]